MTILSENNGRSMVEMIGVLAIVGFLTMGGIWGYVRASQVLRINNVKDEISTLIANIRTMYLTKNDYKTLDVPTLIGSGFVPEKMISSDKTKITNSLKGSVLVGSSATEIGPNNSFILIYNGLDAITCREIAVLSWGSDISSGFLGMSINKTGDLTVDTSNLTGQKVITNGSTTFAPNDLPQAMINDTYNSCDCGNLNTCAIAWKFL